MGNPVVHFEIAVKDGKKGSEFYKNMFDWRYQFDEQMGYYGIEAQGEGSIGGGIFQTDLDKFPPYVSIYIEVNDITKYLEKAVELGGKILVPVMPIGDMGEIGMFADPDGNVIGLWKKK